MKKVAYTLFLTLVCFPFLLFSQSVFQENTKWVIAYSSWGPEGGNNHYKVIENNFDTIINGIEYCHLKDYVGKNYSKVNYTINNKKVYIDTEYYRDAKNPVYDFNLKKGDLIGGYKIDSVSKLSINGRELIVQYLLGGLIFIEGFGCLSKGFVYFDDFTNGGSWAGHIYDCERICINDTAYLPRLKNNVPVFQSTPCMDSVYQHKVSIEPIEKSKAIIYPNPAKEQLTINNFSGKIELFDIAGSFIFYKSINHSQTLDIENLSKGIYYLKLSNDKGSEVIKVLKQ
jgi:hypothetical protein